MLARLFVIVVLLLAPLAAAAAPPAPASLPDDVERYVVGEMRLTQPGLTTIELAGDLYLYRYDVDDRRYDADDMGAAYHGANKYQGQATGDAFVADIETNAENSLRSILSSSFLDATISGVDAVVDVSTLQEASGNPLDPPVALAVTATIERTRDALGLADYTDAQVQAVFDAGAELETTLSLSALTGYQLTYTISAPTSPALAFVDAQGGRLSADAQTVVVQVADGGAAQEVSLTLRGQSAPTFDAEDASIGVLVDIRDVDASAGKALSGDLGSLLVDITVTGNLNVIELPDDVKDSIPENVRLAYLSSDAIRLFREHGLLTQEDLTKVEQALADQVREKLGAALGGSIAVTSGFDADSLAASLISTPASSDDPVVFTATASVRKPLAGGGIEPQAAIALYTQQLPLTLPRIQGMDTTYTVIAPPGLAFTDVTGSGGDITRGTSADGREQFTVRPTGESAAITAAVAVTPAFVMAKFWPIVLVAILLLVLIVGTPVAIVVMKRRKGKAAAPAKEK